MWLSSFVYSLRKYKLFIVSYLSIVLAVVYNSYSAKKG